MYNYNLLSRNEERTLYALYVKLYIVKCIIYL